LQGALVTFRPERGTHGIAQLSRESPELRILSTPAFDPMAGTYDADFTHTPIGRALRDVVWSRLERTFRPAQRILDIGCGGGILSEPLARLGANVVGADPAEDFGNG